MTVARCFYGNLDNDKLLRPLRKYYAADGSMEIKHNIQTGDVELVTYIGGDGYAPPIVLKSDGTTQNYLYLQRDYQSSIVAISDATGQVLEKRLFDAWGNVLVHDEAGNTLSGLTILDRGYTGHEHLQSVGLIHMNGRLYDAKLHRFLQPDNYVQDPGNTQNYNRYGYVLNKPLKYTDPSGELSWKSIGRWLDKNWKSVVVVTASVATAAIIIGSMGTATPLVAAAWASAGAGLVGGSLGVALNGGNFGQIVMGGLKGAAMGAMTGYAGAYMSAAIHAVGIIPGMLSGAATSTTLTAVTNIMSGNDWNAGIGMSAITGTIGGGISGFSAAKASGSGIWFGTEVKPSATVIAGKIDDYTNKAKADYDKSLRSQAKATNESDFGKYPEGHISTERLSPTGTPNSSSMQTAPNGKPLKIIRYNVDGKAEYRIDFDMAKGHQSPVHGHQLTIPGNLGSQVKGQHIPIMEIPPHYFN